MGFCSFQQCATRMGRPRIKPVIVHMNLKSNLSSTASSPRTAPTGRCGQSFALSWRTTTTHTNLSPSMPSPSMPYDGCPRHGLPNIWSAFLPKELETFKKAGGLPEHHQPHSGTSAGRAYAAATVWGSSAGSSSTAPGSHRMH